MASQRPGLRLGSGIDCAGEIRCACLFVWVSEGMNHRSSKSGFSRSYRAAALLGVTAFFAILATAIAAAAEEGEYKPPAGGVYVMEAHLKWCAEGKTVGARIKRFEEFWSLQAPKEIDDGYDDERHIRLVRRCAYRLAELYAQAGRAKECLKMLKFLEKEDEAFKVEQEG